MDGNHFKIFTAKDFKIRACWEGKISFKLVVDCCLKSIFLHLKEFSKINNVEKLSHVYPLTIFIPCLKKKYLTDTYVGVNLKLFMHLIRSLTQKYQCSLFTLSSLIPEVFQQLSLSRP